MDNPRAIQVKTVSEDKKGIVKAAPTATPRKGAIQGVATTVARIPEKKLPQSPDFRDKPAPRPVIDIPISKTPLRLSPKRKSKIANTRTKAGFCN